MILNGKIISVVAFKIKHVRNHEQIIQRKKQYVELVCYVRVVNRQRTRCSNIGADQ